MRVNKLIQVLCVGAIFALLQGCELFNSGNNKSDSLKNNYVLVLCETSLQQETFADFCSLDRWLLFVFETSDMAWPERLAQINELGDDPHSLLLKTLLSQGSDTPYRQRLRAQNWVVKITTECAPAMQQILDELVYENSQQLLEFESAITILSRVNARQEKTISELQAQLEVREQEIKKQQEQVNQLLKIETDLIEQNRSENR